MLIHTLHSSLPPPPPGDDPEAVARRDRDAIAQVASLLPVTAAEGRLAARFVAADARAHECLRLAELYPTDVTQVLKCNAQAATMWRQSDSALRSLERLQEARRKRDSDPAAANQAAWTEHCVQGFMANALHGGPAAFDPAPPPPEPEPEPEPEPAASDGEPTRDPIKEAEFYAAIYDRRAVAIRRHGGMPPNATAGGRHPPRPGHWPNAGAAGVGSGGGAAGRHRGSAPTGSRRGLTQGKIQTQMSADARKARG